MKKILFAPIHYILDAQNSGSEFSWSYDLYIRLSKIRILEVIFLTGGTRGVRDNRVIDARIFAPNKLNLSLINIIFFYIFLLIQSIKLNIINNFDVIHHVLPFAIGYSFNLFALLSNKKFIIGPVQPELVVKDSDVGRGDALGFQTRHNNRTIEGVEQAMIKYVRPIIFFLSLKTLQKASRVIVVNHSTRKELIDLGVIPDNIVIIPPGIDCTKYELRPKLSRKTHVIKLIAVAYLRYRKGVDLILQALQNVVEVRKNVRLCIVGDGPQRSVLEKMTDDLHLRQYVEFAGFIPHTQLPQYLRTSHIFINMSLSESFSTICLEAMASGLCVISSKVGGFVDVITDKENGFLVDIEDYKSLAKRIIYILDNKEKISEVTFKARKTVEKQYDWNRCIIPKYIHLYNSLA